MGRSVSYPSDTLLLAFDHIELVFEDPDTGDWEEIPFAFDDWLEDITETARSLWPSLTPTDAWRGREDHVILRNALIDFGVSEYCGLASIWIVARGDADEGLAQGWVNRIAAKFHAEFGTLRKLGHMSNGEGVFECKAAA